MSVIHFTDPDEVGVALRTDALVPPPAPANLGDGATAQLRNAMARFSHGDEHGPRRDQVIAAFDRLDPGAIETTARALSERFLGARALSALGLGAQAGDERPDLGFVVPTHCMAAALGVPESEWEIVRSDVVAVVAVIGRQEAASEASDRAAERLMQRFADHPDGPVAAISLLYQNHDATAALLAAVGTAADSGEQRRSALVETVRQAAEPTTVGSTAIEAGSTVVLSMEARSNEFGAGPHACPGRAVAEAIVAGIVAATANHRSEAS